MADEEKKEERTLADEMKALPLLDQIKRLEAQITKLSADLVPAGIIQELQEVGAKMEEEKLNLGTELARIMKAADQLEIRRKGGDDTKKEEELVKQTLRLLGEKIKSARDVVPEVKEGKAEKRGLIRVPENEKKVSGYLDAALDNEIEARGEIFFLEDGRVIVGKQVMLRTAFLRQLLVDNTEIELEIRKIGLRGSEYTSLERGWVEEKTRQMSEAQKKQAEDKLLAIQADADAVTAEKHRRIREEIEKDESEGVSEEEQLAERFIVGEVLPAWNRFTEEDGHHVQFAKGRIRLDGEFINNNALIEQFMIPYADFRSKLPRLKERQYYDWINRWLDKKAGKKQPGAETERDRQIREARSYGEQAEDPAPSEEVDGELRVVRVEVESEPGALPQPAAPRSGESVSSVSPAAPEAPRPKRDFAAEITKLAAEGDIAGLQDLYEEVPDDLLESLESVLNGRLYPARVQEMKRTLEAVNTPPEETKECFKSLRLLLLDEETVEHSVKRELLPLLLVGASPQNAAERIRVFDSLKAEVEARMHKILNDRERKDYLETYAVLLKEAEVVRRALVFIQERDSPKEVEPIAASVVAPSAEPALADVPEAPGAPSAAEAAASPEPTEVELKAALVTVLDGLVEEWGGIRFLPDGKMQLGGDTENSWDDESFVRSVLVRVHEKYLPDERDEVWTREWLEARRAATSLAERERLDGCELALSGSNDRKRKEAIDMLINIAVLEEVAVESSALRAIEILSHLPSRRGGDPLSEVRKRLKDKFDEAEEAKVEARTAGNRELADKEDKKQTQYARLAIHARGLADCRRLMENNHVTVLVGVHFSDQDRAVFGNILKQIAPDGKTGDIKHTFRIVGTGNTVFEGENVVVVNISNTEWPDQLRALFGIEPPRPVVPREPEKRPSAPAEPVRDFKPLIDQFEKAVSLAEQEAALDAIAAVGKTAWRTLRDLLTKHGKSSELRECIKERLRVVEEMRLRDFESAVAGGGDVPVAVRRGLERMATNFDVYHDTSIASALEILARVPTGVAEHPLVDVCRILESKADQADFYRNLLDYARGVLKLQPLFERGLIKFSDVELDDKRYLARDILAAVPDGNLERLSLQLLFIGGSEREEILQVGNTVRITLPQRGWPGRLRELLAAPAAAGSSTTETAPEQKNWDELTTDERANLIVNAAVAFGAGDDAQQDYITGRIRYCFNTRDAATLVTARKDSRIPEVIAQTIDEALAGIRKLQESIPSAAAGSGEATPGGAKEKKEKEAVDAEALKAEFLAPATDDRRRTVIARELGRAEAHGQLIELYRAIVTHTLDIKDLRQADNILRELEKQIVRIETRSFRQYENAVRDANQSGGRLPTRAREALVAIAAGNNPEILHAASVIQAIDIIASLENGKREEILTEVARMLNAKSPHSGPLSHQDLMPSYRDLARVYTSEAGDLYVLTNSGRVHFDPSFPKEKQIGIITALRAIQAELGMASFVPEKVKLDMVFSSSLHYHTEARLYAGLILVNVHEIMWQDSLRTIFRDILAKQQPAPVTPGAGEASPPAASGGAPARGPEVGRSPAEMREEMFELTLENFRQKGASVADGGVSLEAVMNAGIFDETIDEEVRKNTIDLILRQVADPNKFSVLTQMRLNISNRMGSLRNRDPLYLKYQRLHDYVERKIAVRSLVGVPLPPPPDARVAAPGSASREAGPPPLEEIAIRSSGTVRERLNAVDTLIVRGNREALVRIIDALDVSSILTGADIQVIGAARDGLKVVDARLIQNAILYYDRTTLERYANVRNPLPYLDPAKQQEAAEVLERWASFSALDSAPAAAVGGGRPVETEDERETRENNEMYRSLISTWPSNRADYGEVMILFATKKYKVDETIDTAKFAITHLANNNEADILMRVNQSLARMTGPGIPELLDHLRTERDRMFGSTGSSPESAPAENYRALVNAINLDDESAVHVVEQYLLLQESSVSRDDAVNAAHMLIDRLITHRRGLEILDSVVEPMGTRSGGLSREQRIMLEYAISVRNRLAFERQSSGSEAAGSGEHEGGTSPEQPIDEDLHEWMTTPTADLKNTGVARSGGQRTIAESSGGQVVSGMTRRPGRLRRWWRSARLWLGLGTATVAGAGGYLMHRGEQSETQPGSTAPDRVKSEKESPRVARQLDPVSRFMLEAPDQSFNQDSTSPIIVPLDKRAQVIEAFEAALAAAKAEALSTTAGEATLARVEKDYREAIEASLAANSFPYEYKPIIEAMIIEASQGDPKMRVKKGGRDAPRGLFGMKPSDFRKVMADVANADMSKPADQIEAAVRRFQKILEIYPEVGVAIMIEHVGDPDSPLVAPFLDSRLKNGADKVAFFLRQAPTANKNAAYKRALRVFAIAQTIDKLASNGVPSNQ